MIIQNITEDELGVAGVTVPPQGFVELRDHHARNVLLANPAKWRTHKHRFRDGACSCGATKD